MSIQSASPGYSVGDLTTSAEYNKKTYKNAAGYGLTVDAVGTHYVYHMDGINVLSIQPLYIQHSKVNYSGKVCKI